MSGAQPPPAPAPYAFADAFNLTDFVAGQRVSSDGTTWIPLLFSGAQILATMTANLQGLIVGSKILNGAAPMNTLGNNGDYFLTTGMVFYGPKAGGVWPATGVSLIGPAGPQGVPGQIGLTGPAGPPGIIGDEPIVTSVAPSNFVFMNVGGEMVQIALVNAVLQSGVAVNDAGQFTLDKSVLDGPDTLG